MALDLKIAVPWAVERGPADGKEDKRGPRPLPAAAGAAAGAKGARAALPVRGEDSQRPVFGIARRVVAQLASAQAGVRSCAMRRWDIEAMEAFGRGLADGKARRADPSAGATAQPPGPSLAASSSSASSAASPTSLVASSTATTATFEPDPRVRLIRSDPASIAFEGAQPALFGTDREEAVRVWRDLLSEQLRGAGPGHDPTAICKRLLLDLVRVPCPDAMPQPAYQGRVAGLVALLVRAGWTDAHLPYLHCDELMDALGGEWASPSLLPRRPALAQTVALASALSGFAQAVGLRTDPSAALWLAEHFMQEEAWLGDDVQWTQVALSTLLQQHLLAPAPASLKRVGAGPAAAESPAKAFLVQLQDHCVRWDTGALMAVVAVVGRCILAANPPGADAMLGDLVFHGASPRWTVMAMKALSREGLALESAGGSYGALANARIRGLFMIPDAYLWREGRVQAYPVLLMALGYAAGQREADSDALAVPVHLRAMASGPDRAFWPAAPKDDTIRPAQPTTLNARRLLRAGLLLAENPDLALLPDRLIEHAMARTLKDDRTPVTRWLRKVLPGYGPILYALSTVAAMEPGEHLHRNLVDDMVTQFKRLGLSLTTLPGVLRALEEVGHEFVTPRWQRHVKQVLAREIGPAAEGKARASSRPAQVAGPAAPQEADAGRDAQDD